MLAWDFMRAKLMAQMKCGHVLVLPLSQVWHLPNLWLLPMAAIPQEGRQPHLIYNYSWSSLNAMVEPCALQEAMHFRAALLQILCKILSAEQVLSSVFLSKVNLLDAYMHVWVQPEHLLALAFVVSPLRGNTEPLISFHLSLPMGYMESAPAFCCATKMVVDLANIISGKHHTALPHNLECIAASRPPSRDKAASGILKCECKQLLDCHLMALLMSMKAAMCHYVNVYIDNFVCLCQGTQQDCLQAQQHLFATIDLVFQPNDAKDHIHQEPNLKKKLERSDGYWST